MRAILGEVKGPNSDSPLTVTTAEAAAMLADPALQGYLAPFIARECTIGQAAKELGVSTNSLLYRVKRFEAADLLRVVREEPRAGRAVKIYRSTADAFYVPFTLTKAETLEALLLRMDDQLQALFYKNVARVMTQTETEVGFVVWRADEAGVRTRFSAGPEQLFDPLDPEAPSVLPFWSPEVWLSPDDAKALLSEMIDLIGRYHYRQGSQRYLLHLALAPLLDAEEA